jgi:hypothetical protein
MRENPVLALHPVQGLSRSCLTPDQSDSRTCGGLVLHMSGNAVNHVMSVHNVMFVIRVLTEIVVTLYVAG